MQDTASYDIKLVSCLRWQRTRFMSNARDVTGNRKCKCLSVQVLTLSVQVQASLHSDPIGFLGHCCKNKWFESVSLVFLASAAVAECLCNGCMPVRAVCKPHSPDLKRGALATDARGCSLWRSLLERPPPAPESRVRDPLGELVRTRVGGLHLIMMNSCQNSMFMCEEYKQNVKQSLLLVLETTFT